MRQDMRRKLLIILLVINLVFGGAFWALDQRGMLVKTYEVKCADPEGAVSQYVLTGDQELSFPFRNPVYAVDELVLKFSGCLDLGAGWLDLEIRDQNRSYYTFGLPVTAITTDDFYLSTGRIPGLREGRSYEVTIKVRDLEQEMTLHLAQGGALAPEEEGTTPFWGYTGQALLSDGVRTAAVCLWVVFAAAGAAVLVFYRRIFTEDRKRRLAELAKCLGRTCKEAHKGIWVCVALLMVLCAASAVAASYDQLEEPRTVGYWSHSDPAGFVNVSLRDGEAVQSFRAKGGRFQEFILFLDNYSPEEEADVWVRLEDEAGNTRYTWTAPISALGGESFCLMGQVDQELAKGETCRIRIWLEGGQSNITVRGLSTGEYPNGFHDSVGDLTIGGEVEGDIRLHFFQSYQVSLAYPMVWGAAVAVALLMMLLAVLCRKSWQKRALGAFCDGCLVLTAYVTIELLSGNISAIEPFFVLLNGIILLGGFGLLKAVAGKAAFYIAVLLTFAAGITDYYVLLFKGSDFLLTEISAFSTAMSVTGTYEFTFPPVVFTTVVLYVCLVLMRVSVDLNGEAVSWKRNLAGRACGLAVGLAAVLIWSWSVKSVSFDYFNLSSNFDKYGWWYTNTIVLKNSRVEKPEGYSDKEIERILSGIEAPEGQEIVPDNIIVIMNEALSDLSMIGQLDTNGDYLPFIRSLEENTVKGNVHVQTYGGGTAISEYEFLTGNTFRFLPLGSMPYTMSVNASGEPGMASTLKAQGYHAVAMHPYGAKNWNRDQVYEAMGFDEFISEDAFEGAERIRDYVSDRANYEKIIEYYEAHRGEKLFVFNVTMQNHGGYGFTNGRMDTTISIDNIQNEEAEVYLSLLQKSDEAFEDLISYFSQVEEPTMIVMFGDHLPALSDEFYTSLYGKADEDRTAEEQSLKYVTPYIIWTNYESDFEQVEETSLNYLGRLVLQYAGVEMSKYDQFILQQKEQTPAIGIRGIEDQDGQFLPYADVADSRLRDYQILQYMRVEDGDSRYSDIFHVAP